MGKQGTRAFTYYNILLQKKKSIFVTSAKKDRPEFRGGLSVSKKSFRHAETRFLNFKKFKNLFD